MTDFLHDPKPHGIRIVCSNTWPSPSLPFGGEWVQEMPDHPDEWSFLIDTDSVDEDSPVLHFYATALESGEWEVGTTGPCGVVTHSGTADTFEAAKAAAETAWREAVGA